MEGRCRPDEHGGASPRGRRAAVTNRIGAPLSAARPAAGICERLGGVRGEDDHLARSAAAVEPEEQSLDGALRSTAAAARAAPRRGRARAKSRRARRRRSRSDHLGAAQGRRADGDAALRASDGSPRAGCRRRCTAAARPAARPPERRGRERGRPVVFVDQHDRLRARGGREAGVHGAGHRRGVARRIGAAQPGRVPRGHADRALRGRGSELPGRAGAGDAVRARPCRTPRGWPPTASASTASGSRSEVARIAGSAVASAAGHAARSGIEHGDLRPRSGAAACASCAQASLQSASVPPRTPNP